MQALSIIISVGSTLIGFAVMFGYYVMCDRRVVLEGGPGWILSILGAPTTFLLWIIHWLGLDNNIVLQYVWVCFFYLLQYQLIALLIFILYKKNVALVSMKSIICLSAVLLIIIFSATLMWKIILPKP